MLTHVCIFWTDKPHGDARDRLLAATRDLLAQIPGPVSIQSGQAVASPRGVVDDSFAVGLTITFPDRETMQRFREDPRHQRFVTEFVLPLSTRRVAYDFSA